MIKKQKWTSDEIEFLKANYKKLKTRECSKKLNRSIHSINYKASELGLKGDRLWQNIEVKFLKENYRKIGIQKCSVHLNRTCGAIHNKAIKLDLTKSVIFTQEETDFLIKYYNKTGPKSCAKYLDHNIKSIYDKANKLGLNHQITIKNQQDEWIIHNLHKGYKYCSDMLGMSHMSFGKKLKQMGLTKKLNFYTYKEEQFIVALCAKQLNRSCTSIEYKARKLGLMNQSSYLYGKITKAFWSRIINIDLYYNVKKLAKGL